jgi:hypothetical protein
MKVFAAAVVSMNLWFFTRTVFSSSHGVWATSCVLGAWLPLVAAAMFSYVRAVGDREDSVAAAWLVRALGVQSVLAWGVGMTDWLRGPPDQPPAWNTELSGPFVLVGFAIPFAAAVFLLHWAFSIGRRLRIRVERPALPTEGHVSVAPFRGMLTVTLRAPEGRAPVAPVAVAALASVVVAESPSAPYWVLFASALPLAALAVRNARALWPGVATLAWISGALVSRRALSDSQSTVSLLVAWPWITASAAALYLAAAEALLRTRVNAAQGGVGART